MGLCNPYPKLAPPPTPTPPGVHKAPHQCQKIFWNRVQAAGYPRRGYFAGVQVIKHTECRYAVCCCVCGFIARMVLVLKNERWNCVKVLKSQNQGCRSRFVYISFYIRLVRWQFIRESVIHLGFLIWDIGHCPLQFARVRTSPQLLIRWCFKL